MDKSSYKPHPHHHHHINGLLITVIILSLILLLMIKPSIDNHLLKRKFTEFGVTPAEILGNIESVQKQQELLTANVSSQARLIEELRAENQNLRGVNLELQGNITRMIADMSFKEREFLDEIRKLNDSFAQKTKEFEYSFQQDQLKAEAAISRFEQLHTTAGRSICCRERVDNPSINSYDIVANRIVCSSSGDYRVTC